MRGRERLGARPDQLEMLGRQAVDQRRRARRGRRTQDDRAEVAPARAGDLRPRQVGELRLDRGRDRVRERRAVGDQDRLGELVVLGLAQQIGRDPGRVLVAVGDHQDLRRPGDQVDADPAEHLPLGLGDIGVAGADDLVDRADAGGAVGQRRDRLGAADPVDLVDPGAARRRPAPAGAARRPAPARTSRCGSTPAIRAGSAFISTELG